MLLGYNLFCRLGYGKKSLFDWNDSSFNNGIHLYFVDPRLDMIEGAKQTGTDRIELYTEALLMSMV
jgi:pyridoxine 5'-phosphate synthase PdxJ